MAEIVGGYQSKISSWSKMETFSPTIIKSLRVLEEYGINIGYFQNEAAPMLLKDVERVDPYQIINKLKDENESLRKRNGELARDLAKCRGAADKTTPRQEKQ